MLTFNNITADSFAADTQQGAGRRRPRHREALSCSQCRERKVRCDRKQPCKQCQSRGQSNSCSYGASKEASNNHISVNSNGHLNQVGQVQQQRKTQTEPSSPLPIVSAESEVRRRLDRIELMLAANSTTSTGKEPHSDEHKPRDRTSSMSGNVSISARNALQCPQGPLLSAKTRFIGGTHWLAACNNMPVLKAMLNKSSEFDNSYKSFAEVKAWTRTANAVSIPYSMPCSDALTLASLLPPRAVSEGWIRTYRQTYRHIYDIVDELTLESVIEKVWGLTGTNEDPTVVCIVILLVSIGMQCDETERLTGRRLARYVEQFAFTSGHLQKPCIGSMEVLLLLTLLKTISCSDTESLDSLSGVMGLTSQVALAMGLHRNPNAFGSITVYHAEIRKRLWSIFFRLNFEYCMRTGLPLALQPEHTDVGYPSNINLTDLTSDTDAEIENQDLSISTEATFTIIASRLASIAAPYQRAICSAGNNISQDSIQELRDAYHDLVNEGPAYLRPGAKAANAAEQAQQAFLTIAMNSTSLVLSLHFVINVPSDSIQASHLHTIWDHSLEVLHTFKMLSHRSRQVQALAYQLLWSDACRAAFSSGMALNRLRVLESKSMMTVRTQHTLVQFQETLLKYLSYMAGFWFQSAHLGPTASKNCLLLAVVAAVTGRLFSDENRISDQELIEVGVQSVEHTVGSMKVVMKRRRSFPVSPEPSVSSTSHSTRMIGETGRSVSSPNMVDNWPTSVNIMTHSQAPHTTTMMDTFPTTLGNMYGPQFITPDASTVGWTPQELQWPMDGFEYSANSASMSPVSHVPSRQTTTSNYVDGLISPRLAGWAGTSQWVEDVGMSF